MEHDPVMADLSTSMAVSDRFHSINVHGNVHDAVRHVNENHVVGFEVFQFIPVSSHYTVVVFKVRPTVAQPNTTIISGACDDRR